MQDFQKRVVDEQSELESKIAKLESFCSSETFLKLTDEQKNMLVIQLSTMRTYDLVLRIRIASSGS